MSVMISLSNSTKKFDLLHKLVEIYRYKGRFAQVTLYWGKFPART